MIQFTVRALKLKEPIKQHAETFDQMKALVCCRANQMYTVIWIVKVRSKVSYS